MSPKSTAPRGQILNIDINAYIRKQPKKQKDILIKARKIILKTLPGCKEKMQWGVPTFAGGKFYIAGLRDSVNIGFSMNGLNKEEMSLFNGNGKIMRHIKINSLKDMDEKNLSKLIKLVNKKAVCKSC